MAVAMEMDRTMTPLGQDGGDREPLSLDFAPWPFGITRVRPGRDSRRFSPSQRVSEPSFCAAGPFQAPTGHTSRRRKCPSEGGHLSLTVKVRNPD